MSTLLLFLLGLCSIASPRDLKQAIVHHRAPAHSSRTSRDLSRSRTGSSRTSAEAESDAEPEVPFGLPRVALRSTYTFAPASRIATRHTLTSLALLPQPPPALQAPRMVCISCSSQDDPSIISTLSFRPDLGRAPPLA
jgi:hypothetical protein